MSFVEGLFSITSVSASRYKWWWIGIQNRHMFEWIARNISENSELFWKGSQDGFGSFSDGLVSLLRCGEDRHWSLFGVEWSVRGVDESISEVHF